MNVLTFEVHTLPTSTSKASFAASHPMQRIICDATETGILRPNVCEGDRIQEESDSDGKVPQSFLIEYTASYHTPLSYKGRARDIHHPRTSPCTSTHHGYLYHHAPRRLMWTILLSLDPRPPEHSPEWGKCPPKVQGWSIEQGQSLSASQYM